MREEREKSQKGQRRKQTEGGEREKENKVVEVIFC